MCDYQTANIVVRQSLQQPDSQASGEETQTRNHFTDQQTNTGVTATFGVGNPTRHMEEREGGSIILPCWLDGTANQAATANHNIVQRVSRPSSSKFCCRRLQCEGRCSVAERRV